MDAGDAQRSEVDTECRRISETAVVGGRAQLPNTSNVASQTDAQNYNRKKNI